MSDDKSSDLLNTAAALDWITPLWAILQDAANGPVARFGIAANGDLDRGDIKRILSKYGVDSWGYIYNVAGDLIMISVPLPQAQLANYALLHGGAMVLYSPVATEPEMATATFSNVTEMATITIVPAPSVWRWLRGLLRRMV